MSALWQGLVAPPARTRPRLRPVADPAPRLARFPFLLVMIGIFGLGMVGLLMLNTTLQNQAFEARALNRQATELAYVQADLEQQLDAHAAPRELALAASQLGMRPNPHPAFLVLPEGRVVGEPTPVSGNELKSLVVKTPEQIAAEKAARAAKAKAAAEKKAAEKKAAERTRRREKKAAEKKAADKKKQQARPRRSRARARADGGRTSSARGRSLLPVPTRTGHRPATTGRTTVQHSRE